MNEFSHSQITNDDYKIYDKWNKEDMLLRNQLGAAIKLNSKEGEEEDGTNIKDKNKAEGKSRYELGKKNKQG